MPLRRVLAPPLWALLGACAGTVPPSPLDPNRLRLALSPASFGQALNLQQQVHVEAQGRTVEFDAVLDIAPDAVTLVGLTLGQRMLTLRYDGATLSEQRHAALPAEVRGADILSDVQLALWPAAAVRAALPAGWTLTDEGQRRTLSHDAQDVAVIAYDGVPRWQGRITLENRQYAYRLVIRSVAAEP